MHIKKRIDAHIHFAHPMKSESLIKFMDNNHIDMANLVLVPSLNRLTAIPEALMAKAKYPDRFYVFTSFDVSEYYRHGKQVGKYMAKFVENMRRCGCDGLKIIEGKPAMRKYMAVPDFDLPCWDPFWEYAEKTELPILWHVNDPETCWDWEKAPRHIKMAGELYDESFINNEVQYQQIFNILDRHPKLKIIFAHLFFMSAQLPRLSALLDKYPNIMVDVTLGLDIYVNLSQNTQQAQAFFEKYQDRVLYGTDIGARCVSASGEAAAFNEDEYLARMDLINGFFTPDTDRIMKEDGRYLINTDDFVLRGIHLSDETLNKIYWENFQRYVGEVPAKVCAKKVIKECRRICTTLKIMSLINKKMQADTSVAKNAIAFFKLENK